ncbi:unnamed protein product [Mytilus edulis]|uniref:Uncharacterized protein n=1 Tax=Mytilus edulis TaxID=6550 RepID=A0A8S3SAB3_MYTED|nr:unnamed protein product [Mytilus edulis]
MGITVIMINFDEKKDHLDNLENLATEFAVTMQELCKQWRDRQLGPLTVVEAINQLNYGDVLRTGSEEWSPKVHQHATVKTPKQYAEQFASEISSTGKRHAMVVIFDSDHAFLVFVDEFGHQIVFDSHLHYKSKEENFHTTLNTEGTGVLIAYFPKGSNCLIAINTQI